MSRWRLLILLLCPSFLSLAAQPVPGEFALKDGDRVVFYGDSITAQRLYTRFTEEIIVSRYPNLHISFYNAGVSGDTVDGGHGGDRDTRLKRDVFPLHPTVVTIMLGMNDGRYTTTFDENFPTYESGYRKLIASLRSNLPGVRIVLICPSPYDEIAHTPEIPGYNQVMIRYSEFVRNLGKELNLPVVDFNRALTTVLRKAAPVNETVAGSLLPDRIHPSPSGHWIMAAALAQGLHIDPIVSSVAIDAERSAVTEHHKTTVTDLHAMPGALSWTQTDSALPLPFELNDTAVQFLLQVSEIEALDRQMLRIRGLTSRHYQLTIDDKKIGTFSREELERGVNLALFSTPMEQAAKPIDWTAEDRAKLSGTRFNVLTSNLAASEPTLQTLDALDRTLVDLEYHDAKPAPHRFQLSATD